jgi:CAP-Gly domain-containing linker protein 1
MMAVQQQQPNNNRTSLSLITNGSRAARYIGMTASQLSQQPQQQPKKKKSRTPSLSVRSSTSSLHTPITSPVSNSGRNSLRRSQPLVQSPTPTHYNRGIPSPAMTPTSHSVQDNADDYYHDSLLSSASDDMMITETPIPANLALSKSITTAAMNTASSTSTSSSLESPHERLERVLGEAISQAPDEAFMRLQQLQLRVEVLEAENKYLKLENTQNKTAEQILERSLVLKKKDDNGEELFTLEGHKAIVEEIKEKHAVEVKTWTTQQQETMQAIQRLETKVQELEAEQQNLITERDRALFEISTVRKEKSLVEHRIHELESKVAEAEAATAAAQAGERLMTEKTKALQLQMATSPTSQQQQFFQPGSDSDAMDRQMKLEMEMEEVHEKMSSLRDAARAKDMFLASLSEQVETHRNAVEEKEREIRRIKADSERHVREKDRLLEELKDVEAKWLAHQDCTSKEVFDKVKKELSTVKENYAKETVLVQEYRERINQLQASVDELKRAGMESIELYESSVEMNRVDREAMNASLADERRKVASLEVEREELRKAGLDAIEVYEATIEEMKKERTIQIEEHAVRREALQATVETLKQEIDQLMKNVETEEKHAILKDVWESERKRLTEQIEILERERSSHEAFKAEAEAWKDQSKETDKLTKEKAKLEEQLTRLQADYDEQLASRTKYLDEVRSAVESQKKTEGELRRLSEAKEKLERDLLEQQQLVAAAANTSNGSSEGSNDKQHQLEIETFRSEIEKLQAQNAMLVKQKEQAEQGQQDLAQYQQLIATLKSENKKIAKEHAKLEESHKQTETECLKLMEEVEKLHQQAGQDEARNLILKEDLSEDDKIAKLLQQNQKKLEQMSIEQATELRKAKERNENAEKEHKRQILMLNRDISELESLIESKIFKEADLEEALEKERKQVKKLMLELQDIKEENKMLETSASTSSKQETKSNQAPSVNKEKNASESSSYCEICEVYGHDLISCKAVSVTKEETGRPVSNLKPIVYIYTHGKIHLTLLLLIVLREL